jgi:hypothetical protein
MTLKNVFSPGLCVRFFLGFWEDDEKLGAEVVIYRGKNAHK